MADTRHPIVIEMRGKINLYYKKNTFINKQKFYYVIACTLEIH